MHRTARGFSHVSSGVSISRMPQRLPSGTTAPAVPSVDETPAAPSPPTEPSQPLGRLPKFAGAARRPAQRTAGGWLGVEMEALELAMAISLGLPNGDGAVWWAPDLNPVRSGGQHQEP